MSEQPPQDEVEKALQWAENLRFTGPGARDIELLARKIRHLEQEISTLKQKWRYSEYETEQILGRALGYPKYTDDKKNFPDAVGDDVCVGDHVTQSLAMELVKALLTTQSERDQARKERDEAKEKLAVTEKSLDCMEHNHPAIFCSRCLLTSDLANRAEAAEQKLCYVRDLDTSNNRGPGRSRSGEGEIMKFRKKPVVIEAVQVQNHWFDPKQKREIPDGVIIDCQERTVKIPTLEGTMDAKLGDWIITGIKGEIYPCKPDIFAATYEPVAAHPKENRL